MESSQNGTSNRQPFPANVQEEAHFEDEINLIDYFKVIWTWKYLILLGSVLPAFIVGLTLFFSPKNYKVTYVYDVKKQSVYDFKGQGGYDVSNWNLNENNYKILLDRFYSAENTSKIATKLQESGLNKYAEYINTGGLKNFVDFEVSPSYTDLSKTKITNPFELEQSKTIRSSIA